MTIEIRPFAVMAGYDGHRGWLYYLASAPERRSEGIGRRLVSRAEELLREMGCPKVQLMVRPENGGVHDFYAASATSRSRPGRPPSDSSRTDALPQL